MHFILFQIGRDRYALSALSIIEVLALMNLKRVPEVRDVLFRELVQS